MNETVVEGARSGRTSGIDRGFAVAARMQSGVVWVNKAQDVPFDVPFHPAKKSGIGTESGLEGVEESTQARRGALGAAGSRTTNPAACSAQQIVTCPQRITCTSYACIPSVD